MRIQYFLIRRLRLRVLIFVVTALGMSFAAGAQNERITLPDRKLSPREVFDIVHAQTPYKITANMSRLDNGISVRIPKSPVAVSVVLDRLFAGTDYAYTVDGDLIVVYSAPRPNNAHVSGSVVSVQAVRTVAGTVTDIADGAPLENITVEILGVTEGKTVSNPLGRFTVSGVPSGRRVVKLTSADGERIRYREITIPASGDAEVGLVMGGEMLMQGVSVGGDTEAVHVSTPKTTAYFVPVATDHTVHAFADEPKTSYSFIPTLHLQNRYLPKAAVKTNLLYLATTTLNVGVEFGLARRWTLDVSAAYNPFQLQTGGVNHVTVVSPEVRYWFCQRFEKHFIGLHALGGTFNLGDVTFLTRTFETHRYDGWGAGGGVSYGYHLPMGGRWAMEFTLGAGYVYLQYDKYRCYECDEFRGNTRKHYLGPTKAGISLVYMIK